MASCQKKDQVGGKGAQLTSIDFGLHRVLICLCPNLIYVKQSATNPPDEKRISQQWDEIAVWLLCNNAADCLQYWLFAQICANIEWQCRDREVWERERGAPAWGLGVGKARHTPQTNTMWLEILTFRCSVLNSPLFHGCCSLFMQHEMTGRWGWCKCQ